MLIDDILERNRGWVRGRKPKPLPPVATMRLAVVACYDPRLDPLLLPALGLEPGQAFLLRSAGALLQPGSATLRSLGLAIFMFGVTEVLVVGHAACRMAAFDTAAFIAEFRRRGVPRDAFGEESLRTWAGAIASPRQGVLQSVATAREAAFVPGDVRIAGVVLDETTGALELVVRPDEAGETAGAAPAVAASAAGHSTAEASTAESARAREAAAREAAASRAAASRAGVSRRTGGAAPKPAPRRGATRPAAGSSAGAAAVARGQATSPRAARGQASAGRAAAARSATAPRATERGPARGPGTGTRAARDVPPPPPGTPAPSRSATTATGNPRLAQTRALLEAADGFLATIESKEHWRQDVENLRRELERRQDARQRLELLDAFAKRLGADSREVAESFARLRKEIAAAGHDPAAQLLSVFHHLGRRR